MAVSAAAAITVSFTYLRDLALYCGWSPTIAWLLPVSCDALAAATLTAYVLSRSWFAATVSAALIAATATGNALAHIYDVTGSQPTLPVVVAVGVAPVANAFLIGHFVAHETRKADPDADTGLRPAGELVAHPDRPRPVPAPRRSNGGGGKPRRRPGVRGVTGPNPEAIAATLRDTGRVDASQKLIMREFGVGSKKAEAVQAALTNGAHG